MTADPENFSSEQAVFTSRPLAVRRAAEILRRVEAVGSVTVVELADAFDVSRETIRRDLKQLAERGDLEVVHGGAVRKLSAEPSQSLRQTENRDGKARIGKLAAGLVDDGCTLLIDSGTTTAALVVELASKRNLTICTNSLGHAMALSRLPSVRVYMLGGEVDANDDAVFGLDTVKALESFSCDLAFVGAGGFSATGDLTDYSRAGAELRARMLTAATRAYVMADHHKFHRTTPIRVPDFERAAGLISDRAPDGALATALRERGIGSLVAP